MAWRFATWRRLSFVVTLLAEGVAWGEEPQTLRGHERWVLSLAESPDGGHLFSGGDD